MENKQRIIQELVPGKQITLAHIIANPDPIMYGKLGLDPKVEYSKSAIGVLTVSPAETAIIMADIGIKSAGVELGFVDRFSGSIIVTGTVSEVEASIEAILQYGITPFHRLSFLSKIIGEEECKRIYLEREAK